MAEKRKLVCIVCPVGCCIELRVDGDKVESISGCKCKRGHDYAVEECFNPVRTLTGTVAVYDGQLHLLPVKSDRPLPKQLVPACIKELKRHETQAPVKIGDVIVEDILNTGINIIATSNILRQTM